MNERKPGRARGIRRLFAGCLLVWMLAAGSALAAEEAVPEVTHDGLHLVPGAKVAIAYAKPDADFSVYKRVMLLDAYVAFKKNWQNQHNRTSVYRITSKDIEQIKQSTATLFAEVFAEELDDKGGYTIVDAPAPDVLLLRPAIIDLDVTSPNVDQPGRSHNFASSAGAASLYLELYDSVSGEILARVVDRQSANHPGDIIRWSNQVTNRAAARKIIADWAGLLRDRLDELHGKKKQ